ncbi:hypothetical protein ES705_41227 [subsurface metagenome]
MIASFWTISQMVWSLKELSISTASISGISTLVIPACSAKYLMIALLKTTVPVDAKSCTLTIVVLLSNNLLL